MGRMATAVLIGFFATGNAWAFDMTKRPVFHDGQWECGNSTPQYQEDTGFPWGKAKHCHLKKDPQVKLRVVYLFNSPEPLFLDWRRGDGQPYIAVKNGTWISLGPASSEVAAIVDFDLKMVARVDIRVWSEKGAQRLEIFNPEYPYAEEVQVWMAQAQEERQEEVVIKIQMRYGAQVKEETE